MIKDYIKKIGTGPHGGRDLTRAEAADAAQLLLSGTATEAQAGALLLGLRLKGETADEMGGFLDALRLALPPITSQAFDLDIGDPYDGKKRSQSLVVPAAIHASRQGVRLSLHGLSRVPVKAGPGVLEAWKALGRTPSGLPNHSNILDRPQDSILCFSQETILPGLARMLSLRQELGLRTIWNTVEKAVNPLKASAQIIGIFHEPVIDKLRQAMDSPHAYTANRLLFVCGAEGGVDLHPHRATFCTLLDRALGSDPIPITIPPPPEPSGPLPSPGEGLSLARFLQDLLNDPDHPFALHLRRQTALFLFASGKYHTFSEAEHALESSHSSDIKAPINALRSPS